MTGPLAMLFGLLKQREDDRRFGGGYYPSPRPHGGLLEDRDMPAGRGPMPYRDPQQAGPEPPVDPRILARMFGDR